MYCSTFCLLGAQYIWADVFHITMTNFQGQPLKNNLIQDMNTNSFNKITNSTVTTNSSNIINNLINTTGGLAWDLVLLITGTLTFDVMAQMGVPTIFIAGFVAIYAFLLIRSIMGWVRGI